MREHWTAPTSDLAILDALGQELGLASENFAGGGRTPPSLRRSRRTLAIALAVLLSVGGGAVAATGILSTDFVPAGGRRVRRKIAWTSVRWCFARGSAPVAGPWRITTYQSEGVVDQGAVLEQRGLPCVELSLTDPPRTPLLGSSFCGREIPTEFTAGSLSVVDPSSGAARLILFGTAPEAAAIVTLRAEGMAPISAHVFDGPDGSGGDLWAVSVPPGPRRGTVSWLRADGTQGGPPREVSDSFSQLERFQRAWRP